MVKEHFLRKKIKHSLLEPVTRVAPAFPLSQMYGLLFTYSNEQVKQAFELKEKLQVKNKQVELLTFLPTEKIQTTIPHYTQKNFSWLGDARSPEVTYFIQRPFDYLICLDDKLSLYIQYVLSASHALCRVGTQVADAALFDLTLVEKDSALFQQHFLQYLAIFK